MAEDHINAASGETPALPTVADMERNMREDRREIGRRARRMVTRCLAGQEVNPDELHKLGPAGRDYFFRELQSGLAQQLAAAVATRKHTAKASRPRPSTAAVGARPVLDITQGWTAQQGERRSYEQRAFRTGGIWALVLTGLAIAIPALFPELNISMIQEGFLNGPL
ncbi:hypothetical protein [Devosia sp. A369]